MPAALSIENLTKTYASGVQALKGVSFDVEAGDFFALLGPNGAGKSTLIGILTSLVRKTTGRVSAFGIDQTVDLKRFKKMLGVVPQEFNFNEFGFVEETIIKQAGYYGMPYRQAKKRTVELLSQLGLADKRKALIRSLSGGMKRRVMIARALVHSPKLLLLDEPTAGVDIELRRSMWEFMAEINQAGATIILTTHYLEEAESLCRNIAIINHGHVVKHSRMSDLLGELEVERFILYPELTPDVCPCVEGYVIQFDKENPSLFEVEICADQTITDLIEKLKARNIIIKSFRNKANRLEELFVRLTSEGK